MVQEGPMLVNILDFSGKAAGCFLFNNPSLPGNGIVKLFLNKNPDKYSFTELHLIVVCLKSSQNESCEVS